MLRLQAACSEEGRQVNPVLEKFDKLSVWSRGDQRAPHKPLLILYALGRWQAGLPDVTFLQAEKDLTTLLREFGPPRRSDHPEQPYWRLQNDAVWTVSTPADLPTKKRGDTGARFSRARLDT
jgi:putative restriction endonuclease